MAANCGFRHTWYVLVAFLLTRDRVIDLFLAIAAACR
jgi:hypothetical protein